MNPKIRKKITSQKKIEGKKTHHMTEFLILHFLVLFLSLLFSAVS